MKLVANRYIEAIFWLKIKRGFFSKEKFHSQELIANSRFEGYQFTLIQNKLVCIDFTNSVCILTTPTCTLKYINTTRDLFIIKGNELDFIYSINKYFS